MIRTATRLLTNLLDIHRDPGIIDPMSNHQSPARIVKATLARYGFHGEFRAHSISETRCYVYPALGASHALGGLGRAARCLRSSGHTVIVCDNSLEVIV